MAGSGRQFLFNRISKLLYRNWRCQLKSWRRGTWRHSMPEADWETDQVTARDGGVLDCLYCRHSSRIVVRNDCWFFAVNLSGRPFHFLIRSLSRSDP